MWGNLIKNLAIQEGLLEIVGMPWNPGNSSRHLWTMDHSGQISVVNGNYWHYDITVQLFSVVRFLQGQLEWLSNGSNFLGMCLPIPLPTPMDPEMVASIQSPQFWEFWISAHSWLSWAPKGEVWPRASCHPSKWTHLASEMPQTRRAMALRRQWLNQWTGILDGLNLSSAKSGVQPDFDEVPFWIIVAQNGRFSFAYRLFSAPAEFCGGFGLAGWGRSVWGGLSSTCGKMLWQWSRSREQCPSHLPGCADLQRPHCFHRRFAVHSVPEKASGIKKQGWGSKDVLKMNWMSQVSQENCSVERPPGCARYLKKQQVTQ